MSMYTMSQHPYMYAAAPPPSRHYEGHGTSSAFSSSANPDEDWTKISDLAERRRIQNRIAQRNYRKKLKRRLEDLERRAGSTDEAEPERPAPINHSVSSKSSNATSLASSSHRQSPSSRSRQTSGSIPSHGQYTPPMENSDELGIFNASGAYADRERSNTPPIFNYSNYSAHEGLVMDSYSASPSYPAISTTPETYPNYMAASSVPVTVTLPSMTHFTDAVSKKDPYPPAGDERPSYMSYGFLPGSMDMPSSSSASAATIPAHQGMPSPYGRHQGDPHTPPLSTSSFEDGFGAEFPVTPLSMADSPPYQPQYF